MTQNTNSLSDSFGRVHNYLRISLTEKCNLRCTYCMPEEGVILSPKSSLMTSEEVLGIAQQFVESGVTKIRITGGEPLLRKDISEILEGLSRLPVDLSLTTNAILVDRHLPLFKKINLKKINVSLDSLNAEKFNSVTKRDQFERAHRNLMLLMDENFKLKINAVLIKKFNDSEIIDLIEFTKDHDVEVRFIEFMPFLGNKWDKSKLVSYQEVLAFVYGHFGDQVTALDLERNFTSRRFRVNGYAGSFGIISTVTNPFCDSCNRIRLTANGKIKNCLFSADETDILTEYRKDGDIMHLIQSVLHKKKAVRAGLTLNSDFADLSLHDNRSMITIGG